MRKLLKHQCILKFWGIIISGLNILSRVLALRINVTSPLEIWTLQKIRNIIFRIEALLLLYVCTTWKKL